MPFMFVTQINNSSNYEIGQSKLSVGKFTEVLEKEKTSTKTLRYDIGSESLSSVKQAEAFLHREFANALVSSDGSKSKTYDLSEDELLTAVERARDVLSNHEQVEQLKEADVIEEMVDPSESDQQVYEELLKVRQEIQRLQVQKDILEDQLKMAIGERTGITGIATWKGQSTSRIDSKALKEAHPDIAEQYSKTTYSRVLKLG